MLSDADFARFVAGLSRESFEIIYPEYNPGEMRVRTASVLVGGIRASLGANDIKAIIEQRDELLRRLEDIQDSKRAKVWIKGGSVIIGSNEVVEVRDAKKVVFSGPAKIVESLP